VTSILPQGRLSWGIQLPVQAQSTRFAEAWEAQAGPAELEQVARAADAAGCFYIAVCEHLAIPRAAAETMGTTWYHTLTTLGWLAAHTQRVRLLSHVTIPHFRHPLEAAKAFMTLDRLSGGRAIAGVGAGHVVPELEMLGIEPSERGALLDEAIAVMQAAFESEYPRTQGPRWKLDGELGVAPRPVQSPLPVWVGGSSRAAIRRAARLGDGWLPQGTSLLDMPAAIALLRGERSAAGRSDEIDIGANLTLHHGRPGWDVGPALTGQGEALATDLRRWTELGVGQLQIHFRSRSATELADQLAAFGTETAPLL
jgi:probable F420-dependent oxidoreductase